MSLEQDPRYKSYLFQFERYLQDLSALERARLVLRAHEELTEAMNSTPNANVFNVLGAPQNLARKLRQEQGYSPRLPHPNTNRRLWITLLFLIIFFFIGPSFLFYRMISPFFDMDWNFNSFVLNPAGSSISHSVSVDGPQVFTLDTQNGQFDVVWSNNPTFKVDCQLSGPSFEPLEHVGNEIRFHTLADSNCEFQIPNGSTLNAAVENGQIRLIRPSGPIEASLNQGHIEFTVQHEINYEYDFNVGNGVIEGSELLPKTRSGERLKMRLDIENGNIRIFESNQ